MDFYNKILTLVTLLLISHSNHADSFIHIRDGWINEAPPGVRVLAGYMTIMNQSNELIELISLSSPDFESVEIHQTRIIDEIAKMQKVNHINIIAGSSFQFKPGAYHLMLINPLSSLKQGDTIQLDLVFSNNEQITLNMPVKRRTDSHVHEHHH